MAAVCANCVTGYKLPGEGTGEIIRVAPNVVEAYLSNKNTKIVEGATEKKAVVFLTDMFGLPLGNPKIMADTINERLGVDVWVPDLFNGRYIASSEDIGPFLRDTPTSPQLGFLQKAKAVFTLLSVAPAFYASRPKVAGERTEAFIKAIKEKGYTDIGAVGYVLTAVLRIATEASLLWALFLAVPRLMPLPLLGAPAGHVALIGPPLVKTVVVAHPSGITDQNIKDFKVPSSWIIPEDDSQVPASRYEIIKTNLAANGHEFEFKVYNGTCHGFAARPNLGIPEVKQAFEDALDQAINWFRKTL